MTPKYKLSYYDAKGITEPIRFLFSYGGVAFEDVRFNKEQWLKVKPTTPFGRVPILEVDGKVIHQSTAICRYLAQQFGLTGSNDLEAQEIDAIVDSFGDLRQELSKYHYFADDAMKKQLLGPLKNETIPFYMSKFDEMAKKNKGYLASTKLTWADLYFVACLDYMNYMAMEDLVENYPNLKTLKKNVLALPSIKAWVEKRPVTEM